MNAESWSFAATIAAIIAAIAAYIAHRAAALAERSIRSSRDSRLAAASSDLACSQESTFCRSSDPGTPYSPTAVRLATSISPSFSREAAVSGLTDETPNVRAEAGPTAKR